MKITWVGSRLSARRGWILPIPGPRFVHLMSIKMCQEALWPFHVQMLITTKITASTEELSVNIMLLVAANLWET